MDYYRRYVGDYLADTQGLSMIEDGAYGRLLDYYYAKEGPLPPDLDAVHRIARATTPAERKAVAAVLHEHFELRATGYHNPRADRELGVAVPKIEKLREVARENGRKGGRPKKTESGSGMETGTGSDEKPDPVPKQKQPARLNHPPTASHQPPPQPFEQRFPGEGDVAASPPAAAAEDSPPDPERLAFAIAECGRAKVEDASPTSRVLHRMLRMSTNTQFAKALADSRLPFRKPFPQKLTLGYVETVLADIVSEEAKARAAAEAKIQRTQQTIAEQRAAAERSAPMPDHLRPKRAAA